jgi:hypothetical protein
MKELEKPKISRSFSRDEDNLHMETSEDEELTDDETFLRRHWFYEQDEIKRYNIGIVNKRSSNSDKIVCLDNNFNSNSILNLKPINPS